MIDKRNEIAKICEKSFRETQTISQPSFEQNAKRL